MGRLIHNQTHDYRKVVQCFPKPNSRRRTVFNGAKLFELKATHGFPLDFALDRIINEKGMPISWVDFIEAARKNKWWDFQTIEVITHALEDAQVASKEEIINRAKLYMMKSPQEKNT
jgi:alanyl-tRNA synthetase